MLIPPVPLIKRRASTIEPDPPSTTLRLPHDKRGAAFTVVVNTCVAILANVPVNASPAVIEPNLPSIVEAAVAAGGYAALLIEETVRFGVLR